jgi:hypothetical protein
MKAKIGNDINYNRKLLVNYHICKSCGCFLLMDGCDNPTCHNFWKKRINEKLTTVKK